MRSQTAPTTIVLFDIDGTLVLTGGAGRRALGRAIQEVFRVDGALDGVAIPGRLDPQIIEEALARAGLEPERGQWPRLRERYIARLTEELRVPHPRKTVMPGVAELLAALGARPDAALGLLTGNFRESARLKLEHFDLWRYFDWGAFGDDAPDRNGLVPVALDRARSRGVPAVEARRVLVVGDTPHDVGCAVAYGARAIAVATGSAGSDALRASGAEVVFETLADTSAFLRLLD